MPEHFGHGLERGLDSHGKTGHSLACLFLVVFLIFLENLCHSTSELKEDVFITKL